MGTNYYHHKEVKPACECCKRGPDVEVRHIGKSSAGWCFSLHVIPEDGITCLEDWEARWSEPGTWIEDEYGRQISAEQMREVIAQRSWKWTGGALEGKWLRDNHALPGPNGLVRHALGWHCIGHGEGTWDYIVGEFS